MQAKRSAGHSQPLEPRSPRWSRCLFPAMCMRLGGPLSICALPLQSRPAPRSSAPSSARPGRDPRRDGSAARQILTPAPLPGRPWDHGGVEGQPRRQALRPAEEAELVPGVEVQADEPARGAAAVPGEACGHVGGEPGTWLLRAVGSKPGVRGSSGPVPVLRSRHKRAQISAGSKGEFQRPQLFRQALPCTPIDAPGPACLEAPALRLSGLSPPAAGRPWCCVGGDSRLTES